MARDDVRLALGVLAALGLAWLAHRLLFAAARRMTRPSPLAADMVAALRRPAAIVLPLLALKLPLQALDRGRLQDTFEHVTTLGMIAAATWLAIRIVHVAERHVVRGHRVDVEDNLLARRVHTQARVLGRFVAVILGVIGTAIALMTFPDVRHVGASLLASAGLAGLIVGFAARPVLSNLLAGLQIALTQPIRLDDVVIVEGEWGRIEEITGAYVVVRIWDLRRLVVPLSHFIERPFENWTRTSADLLGTALLWTDYAVPLDAMRAELERLCRASAHWDGQLCKLQVVETSERAIQVRALVSAADASALWDLRCEVREGLVTWLRREHPEALPRLRVDGDGEAAAAAG